MTILAVSISKFVYSRTLRCYPPVLREQYGPDMTAVFDEKVEAAWSRESWRGTARAWLGVTHDLVGIIHFEDFKARQRC